ncbi:MAG: hypothetical protein JRJ39_08370, partial [Deltaproteobacteria bacterium]|nr:hypothetical protein [Deltaproteobacteria bacterium]
MKFFNKLTKKIRDMDGLTKVALLVFVILAITTSIFAFGFVKNLTAGMTILNLPGIPILDAITGQDSSGIVKPASDSGIATPEPWDGKSRVTILVLGLDYADWRAGDTAHSDTMILL